MNKYLAGAIAGTLATVPMTLLMTGLNRLIPAPERQELPPEQITERMADMVGADEMMETDGEEKAVSLVNHFLYGAACGAVYPLVASRVSWPVLLKGPLFGGVVWTVSYLGWLPLAGILPPATKDDPRRNALMIAAHAVWGAVLGESFKRMRRG